MSGEEIIMSSNAYFGPIDPQVINKAGYFVPAQPILTFKAPYSGKRTTDI
jgi:hypothetical protein